MSWLESFYRKRMVSLYVVTGCVLGFSIAGTGTPMLFWLCGYWFVLKLCGELFFYDSNIMSKAQFRTSRLRLTWVMVSVLAGVLLYTWLVEPAFWAGQMETFTHKTDHWSSDPFVRQNYVRNKILYMVLFPLEFLIPTAFLALLFPIWGRPMVAFIMWVIAGRTNSERGTGLAYILGTALWFSLELFGVHPRWGISVALFVFLVTELVFFRTIRVTRKTLFFWVTGFFAVFVYLPWLAPFAERTMLLTKELQAGNDSVLAEQAKANLLWLGAMVPLFPVLWFQWKFTRGWLSEQWLIFKASFDIKLPQFPE